MKLVVDVSCVVLTSDLDFSAPLAASDAAGPSVLQVRTQDVLPESLGAQVVRVLFDLTRIFPSATPISRRMT